MADRLLLPALGPSTPIIVKGKQHQSQASASAITYPLPKRSNATRACQECRRRKVRCNGCTPCYLCSRTSKECVYLFDDRRRHSDMQEHLSVSRSKIEHLEATINLLKFGTEEEAQRVLKELRGTPVSTLSSPCAPEIDCRTLYLSYEAPRQNHAECDANRQDHHHSFHHDSVTSPKSCATKRPAPGDIVRKAALPFFDAVSTLYFMLDQKYLESVPLIIHDPDFRPAVSDITELCAMASFGTMIRPQEVSKQAKDALFQKTVDHVNHLVARDSSHGLSCLACLCLLGIYGKWKSTPTLIHLAIKVAQSTCHCSDRSRSGSISQLKMLRTLIYLECWLSTSLGYEPSFTWDQVHEISLIPTAPADDWIEMSQAKLCELALLKVKVLHQICFNYPTDPATIEHLMAELEACYESLPDQINVMTLMSTPTPSQNPSLRRTTSVILINYFGSVVLLHRRVLVAIMASDWWEQTRQSSNPASERVQLYRNRCVDAARTILRIYTLMDAVADVPAFALKEWLFMYESFTCLAVLIYDCTLHFIEKIRDQQDEVRSKDLDLIQQCLNLTRRASEVDHVAAKFAAALCPIHERMHEVCQMLSTRTGDSDHITPLSNVLASKPSESNCSPVAKKCQLQQSPQIESAVTAIIEGLRSILNQPFGPGRRANFELSSQEGGEADWWDISET